MNAAAVPVTSHATVWSIARYVAWRNLKLLMRSPALLVPALLLPLFFFIAFNGALSSLTNLPGFGSKDYSAFQFVFALMQSAGFTGAMGGFAMSEDFESGFMDRLMTTASARAAIILGYVIAMLGRFVIAAIVLTPVAYAFGMRFHGNALQIVGLYGLAAVLNVIATLWATGVAMHVRSFAAAPGMFLPIFLLFFLAPVFLPLNELTGWLHSVAVVNPFTRFLEAGRGFLSGENTDVLWAFGAGAGLVVLTGLWALKGVRSASRG
ncbi:MAG: ABC transporter permease [Actinobacteria bacterium]|nr:ABC transporter permease [Actinomycetota bacterium]